MALSENLRDAIQLTKQIQELVATRAELKAGIMITEMVVGPKHIEHLLEQHPMGQEISAEIALRRVAIAELV